MPTPKAQYVPEEVQEYIKGSGKVDAMGLAAEEDQSKWTLISVDSSGTRHWVKKAVAEQKKDVKAVLLKNAPHLGRLLGAAIFLLVLFYFVILRIFGGLVSYILEF
jgi:hypothetical protein